VAQQHGDAARTVEGSEWPRGVHRGRGAGAREAYLLDRTIANSRFKSFALDAAGADLDTYEPGPLLPGHRTSMINDPPDGSIPALTPDARRALNERNQHLEEHYAENPEDVPNSERCIVTGNTFVPPLLPSFFNNTLQIVQSHDAVAILCEMIHDVRVISLTRRTHLPASIRKWAGDSIGRWEGDALVVDTTNFSTKTTLRGSGTGLHLVERFSLSNPNTLKYEFTIDDPASFVRVWTADSQMTRTTQRMYEYACHEAHYSMTNVLRGARFSEKQKEEVAMSAQGSLSDEQDVGRIPQDLARAWMQHDRAFIEGVLAPEWSVTQADGTILTRATVLGPFFDSVSFDSNVVDDVSVMLFGDTAVVRGRTTVSARVNGAPVSARIRFTDVFIKRNGRWQAVASHASTLTAP